MKRQKILIVDDSSTTLLMEQMLLQGGPFDLITAMDGQQAVEKALAERPDLILLDVVMPVMNGFEACRKLRSEAQTKTIPIIMVTTRDDERLMGVGFESGCNDFVGKPLKGPELLTKIRKYLPAAD